MSALAKALHQARLRGTQIDPSEFACPATLDEAYALQTEVMARFASAPVGWKLGATNAAAMAKLGLPGPFLGPLLAEHWFDNDAEIHVTPALGPLLETEFVVTLGADLPARAEQYSLEEIEAAVEYVGAAFEIVSSRVKGGLGEARLLIMPDGAANHAVVEGVRGADWREANLREHPLTVTIDDEEVASGSSNLLLWGSPTQALTWLVNHPLMSSRGLRSGERIMTGTCGGMIALSPGAQAHADFGCLGTVSARIVA